MTRTNTISLAQIWIVTIVLFCASGPAAALTLPGSLVYAETFDGEMSYLTNPEVDTLGAGGVGPVTSGNQPPPNPTFSATAAQGVLTGSAGFDPIERINLLHDASAIGSNDLGVRGFFESFSILSSGDALGTTSAVAIYTDAAVSATLFWQEIGGLLTLGIAAVETNLLTNVQTSTLAILSASDAALVTGGAAYILEILVDRGAGTAVANVDVAGGGTYTTSALALVVTVGNTVAAGTSASLDNGTFGANDTMSIDFDEIQTFAMIVPPVVPPVPSMLTPGISALVTALLALAIVRLRRINQSLPT